MAVLLVSLTCFLGTCSKSPDSPKSPGLTDFCSTRRSPRLQQKNVASRDSPKCPGSTDVSSTRRSPRLQQKLLPADGKYFSLVLLACQIDAPSCGFFKNVSSIERVEPWFFVTFNIILKYIFPENLIEFPQVVQKICRNTLSILAIFINFRQFF